jgi:hypothetical protein
MVTRPTVQPLGSAIGHSNANVDGAFDGPTGGLLEPLKVLGWP